MYNFGDILLLKFPFTDSETVKKRPALVLLDTKDDDLIMARITKTLFNSEFDVKLNDWSKAGLLSPSVVRLHKVATIEKTLIDRKLGRLSEKDSQKILNKINVIKEKLSG